MGELVLTSISISLFCLGWFVVTQPGYLLGFIGDPYRSLEDRLEILENRKDFLNDKEKRLARRLKISVYIGKPFIGCPACFGSFWTIFWNVILFSPGTDSIPYIIFQCFQVSFLNALLVNIYYRSDV